MDEKVGNPICYNAPVSQKTDPAVEAAGLFDNVENDMETVQQLAEGDKVVWRQGWSKYKSQPPGKRHLPIGLAGCKIYKFGNAPGGTLMALIELPWVKIRGSAMADWFKEQGILEDEMMWVIADDLDKND